MVLSLHSVCPLHSSAKPCVSFRKQLTLMQNLLRLMATPIFCSVCRIPQKYAYHLGSLYYFMCDWLLVWYTCFSPDTLILVVNTTRYQINVTWKEGTGKTETGLSPMLYIHVKNRGHWYFRNLDFFVFIAFLPLKEHFVNVISSLKKNSLPELFLKIALLQTTDTLTLISNV